jgi:hypothetical protein
MCGAIEARCSGEPVRVSICHCLDCKRRTGSAFSLNATFPHDQVERRGEAEVFTHTSDEGHWGRHAFCGTCGTTVYYEIERRPGMVTIPVGAFADPDVPAPTVEVYGERRPGWLPALTETQE